MNTKYANAYKEVLMVIETLVKEDYEKIPKDYIEFLEKNSNPDYDFEYDKSKPFDEQILLDDTKYILFGLFEKYGATEKQKAKIQAFKNNYYEKLEKEKREKYNIDDIFKKDDSNQEILKETKENLQIMGYKEQKWYQKILEKIWKILKK